MNLIVCIDDMGGMSFGGRRCSRDSSVYADILSLAQGGRLVMNSYSAKQFADADLVISEDPLQVAGMGDWCFVENLPIQDSEDIEKLIIYRWNRRYPADNHLKIDLKNRHLTESAEFAGSSHENITKEIYTK